MTKKLLILSLVFTFFFLSTSKNQAQTVLNQGEVMIIGYYGDGLSPEPNCNDAFAFTSYVDLLPGTEIRFSEEDFDQWGAGATEGDLIWTNNTGNTISALTGINIVTHSQMASCGSTASASMGSISFQGPGSWALGGSNEEIFVYQSSSSLTLGTMISAFYTDDSTSPGHIPPAPFSTINIIDLESLDEDADVAVYSGPTTFSSLSDFVAQLTNVTNNWSTQDGGGDNGMDGVGVEYPGSLPSGFPLSTDDFSFDRNIKIYPNPSNSGSITIANPGLNIQSVSIIDINGRILNNFNYEGINQSIELDLSLSSGIYMFKIVSDNKSTIKKVIIK
ncbi:T9SS type A sorting domain-containing protein [Winogradskyella sp.]|uniref:T9SS type A sorting domain-containing protein n=1 Tax=Winogradskyella sp. TaxID=1883156 RepID=UPI0025D1DE9D|nr:T9SS type A sorting domain-containing protein [Winogradskyella sp.]